MSLSKEYWSKFRNILVALIEAKAENARGKRSCKQIELLGAFKPSEKASYKTTHVYETTTCSSNKHRLVKNDYLQVGSLGEIGNTSGPISPIPQENLFGRLPSHVVFFAAGCSFSARYFMYVTHLDNAHKKNSKDVTPNISLPKNDQCPKKINTPNLRLA